MTRPPPPTVLLDLPAVAGRSALRAGLMALRVYPGALPVDRKGRSTVLRGLGERPQALAFIDISTDGNATAPTLLELDAAVPRNETRQRVFLTRLTAGHVSDADRRWVQSLGFADLLPEFDATDCEGSLRTALDAVAHRFALAPLAPAELTRYARVLNDERATGSPRATLRALAGSSAEDFAALLNRSLDIQDRSYHLQRFPRCFVGSEAVEWVASHLRRSSLEAVAAGQALAALGLLAHVTHEHPLLDDRLFYRLAVSEAADRVALGDALRSLRGQEALAGVPIADRSYLGKTYTQCFVGSDAVNLLCERHGLARHDAWVVLHRLAQFGLLAHVTLSRPFIDGAFFYRFAGLPPDGETT